MAKKALTYVGCWLLIILAFAVLVILVGPWLIAAWLIEQETERGYDRIC